MDEMVFDHYKIKSEIKKSDEEQKVSCRYNRAYVGLKQIAYMANQKKDRWTFKVQMADKI